MDSQPAISVTELEARIAQISSDIALQQEVLKGLERKKSAAQRQLNAIRDPVARLPLEISSEIFLGCLTSPRKPGAHIAPLLFLNICNTWTDIALSTPALWDAIELDFRGADCLRSWLPRSGKRMLTIALYRGLDHSVVEVLNQYATQIKHLTLREEADDELHTLAVAVESFPQLGTLIMGGLLDEYDDYAIFSSSVVLNLLRLAPNLVEFTLEAVDGLHVADSPNLILSRLTSLKFNRLYDAEGILLHLTTPALETLDLPHDSITNATFSLFFRRSSPPLEKLVLSYSRGDLIQVPSSVRHLELDADGMAVASVFSGLQNLPSDYLQNLQTLILRIHAFNLAEIVPSSYDALFHFLSPRYTVARLDLICSYADRQPSEHVCEVFRHLVDRGMQVWIGDDEYNYLPGWLQQPNGMTLTSDYEAFKRDRMRNWFPVDG
ncbi:hypothetical protein B0H16DRAFT_1894536 [Mycena metata]|uniref:F-box domain-containing protein n=1 Tax=Mycena metata TaxID=1033252 RepID=A0AAD7HSB2_9AGAR|nr:hypothetical protein B0H16DRAFT_1894536 [Mycena metata]